MYFTQCLFSPRHYRGITEYVELLRSLLWEHIFLSLCRKELENVTLEQTTSRRGIEHPAKSISREHRSWGAMPILRFLSLGCTLAEYVLSTREMKLKVNNFDSCRRQNCNHWNKHWKKDSLWMWPPNFYFFTHAQRNLTQLDYFWACTEGTPPHFKEIWRPGARRLNRYTRSSESSERVRKESMLYLKTISHWSSILSYHRWYL